VSAAQDWFHLDAASLDAAAETAAGERQLELTKPTGSLGRLETLAIRLAGMQGRLRPRVDQVQISVFAADHGVAAEQVSAYPQAVTAEMIKNFARGGAAISVLARALGARLEVVDLGTAFDSGTDAGVLRRSLGPGTGNFVHAPAMTEAQVLEACQIGRECAERAQASDTELFIGGDMGIGNTTAAAALACALLKAPARELAGPGTGVDPAGVARKIAVIERALALHATEAPWQALRCVGGFEIAALTGAYIACARQRLPMLIDGFVASAAALAATRLSAGAERWMLFAHRSAEPGHSRMLTAMGGEPLLSLGMRLGEGSGAAVAVPLLRLACALHAEMATFAEAGVPRE
jgi:nicotinate-nucleotide--dimethylbenzimidazole phosphoribosyltransferase